MKNLKKSDKIIGVAAAACLLFSVMQMFLEAWFDIWMFKSLIGYHAAQLFLILGLFLLTFFLIRWFDCSKNKVVLVFAGIMAFATFIEVFTLINIILITHMAKLIGV